MTTLKLIGRFAYVDPYAKLRFSYIDMDEVIDHYHDRTTREFKNTYNKLMRHCVETEPGSMAMPFSDDEFTVHVRGNMFNGEHPKSAFADFIGRDCAVYVTVNKYSFRSSFEYNKGVLLEGYNLYLADIQLHGAFSL